MQSLPAPIVVSDDRARRMFSELQCAISQMSASEIGQLLLADSAKDFMFSIARRGLNIANLAKKVHSFTVSEIEMARNASQRGGDELAEHIGQRIGTAARKLREVGETSAAVAHKITDNPAQELFKLAVVAFAAIASSGGADGNGGLPDIDIPLMGIGAHRSPITHSILIGAGLETLIGALIRTVLLTHSRLPVNHDPVWDQFASHGPELLDAVARGASIGISYHLLVDGLVQPAPYHGLPFSAPIEVHQALLAANGLAEGLDGFVRESVQEKTEETVQAHLAAIRTPFELDPELAEWLGDDAMRVLAKHGSWMLALTCGEIKPYTDAQVHFLLSAHQLCEFQTKHEKIWRQFINVVRIVFIFERAKVPKLLQWFSKK